MSDLVKKLYSMSKKPIFKDPRSAIKFLNLRIKTDRGEASLDCRLRDPILILGAKIRDIKLGKDKIKKIMEGNGFNSDFGYNYTKDLSENTHLMISYNKTGKGTGKIDLSMDYIPEINIPLRAVKKEYKENLEELIDILKQIKNYSNS